MASNADTDILLDHNYDGIQEYDNPLPGWWSALFVGTIVFSALYLVYHHSGVPGRSVYDDYDREAAEVFERRFAELGELTPDRKTLLTYMNDEKWRAVGQAIFKANCTSCHGDGGLGNVGPNLTDDHWKHVRSIEDIAKVIANGAAGGAMPAWKNRLSHPNQIVLTAAYVASLRGKGGGGGKPPEGEKIPPWQ